MTKILPWRERHECRVLDLVRPICVIYKNLHDSIAFYSGGREIEDIVNNILRNVYQGWEVILQCKVKRTRIVQPTNNRTRLEIYERFDGSGAA